MGQMFDKTHDQMNNWRWNNPDAFGDDIDCSNPQATSSGKIKRTGERSFSNCSDELRAKIELPSWQQYEPGDILAVRPQNWDEILVEDDDDENWADPEVPSSGGSHPGHGNDNHDAEGEEDTQGGESGTGKGKGTNKGKGKGKATEDGKGKRKWKMNENGKWKDIVKQTPGGDDISRAVALLLPKEMSEADSDTEG